MLIHLNNENYDEIIQGDIVIVDFYAEWCGPCKMLTPILEEISKEENIKIIKVDVDKHLDIAKKFGIMSVPTMYIYKNGNIVNKLVGFIPKDELLSKVALYK